MKSPRNALGLALIAMTVAMFVPLPLWGAVTLMSIALISAIVVVLQLARSREEI